ncbi:MAG: SAVED domain-containing protein [Dehalococcoidia bacterium]
MLGRRLRKAKQPVPVDPRGPVFISYRRNDGLPLAVETAWALRAAGVPVWRDLDDLPPGDTSLRLGEALASGLSGAVLLMTPDVGESRVIREIELPQLLSLARSDAFTLSVASAIEREPGKLDYEKPDELLGLASGTLAGMNQQPIGTARQRADVARAQARRRMAAIRPEVEAAGALLLIDIQTRIPPFAARADADLVLRLRPPVEGDRRPNRSGLEDLRHFLADLPELRARAGADHVRVRGGAHLSAAFALGAALPTTLMGRVEAVDTEGQLWSLNGNAQPGAGSLIAEVSRTDGGAHGEPVAVFLDLLPTRSDAAFDKFIAAHVGDVSGVLHLRPAREGTLAADTAAVLVGEAALRVRQFAGAHGVTDVHFLLRCPWTVALLLGRTLNTLRVHVYEWEDGPADDGSRSEPRYLPSLIVRSGVGGSPIEQVVLPARPSI